MASIGGGRPVSSPQVRPKERGKCLICGLRLLLSNKSYYSIRPRPNNLSDKRKKEAFVKFVEFMLEDIIDQSKSHIVCDSCHRGVLLIQKADKQKADLRQKFSNSNNDEKGRSKPSPIGTPTKTPQKLGRPSKRLVSVSSVLSPSTRANDGPRKKTKSSPSKSDLASPRGSRIPIPVCRSENIPPLASEMSTFQQSPSRNAKCSTKLTFEELFGNDEIADHTDTVDTRADVTICHAGVRKTRHLTEEWLPVAEALYHGDEDRAILAVLQLPKAKPAFLSQLVSDVQRECAAICASNSTTFKVKSPKDIMNWSHEKQEHELVTKAPMLHAVLEAAAMNESQLNRNKIKTRDAVSQGVLSAAGVLLNCRNERVNAHQMLTALQLKHGGASQQTFERMNKRFLCVSYKTLTILTDTFAKDFDKDAREWAKQMAKDDVIERELIKLLESATGEEAEEIQCRLDRHNQNRNPGICLIGDNVDMRTHARYMGIGRQDKDMHMFNMLMVENRIPGYHLRNDKPIAKLKDVPLKSFLPGLHDNDELRNTWIVHVARILSHNLKAFSWLEEEAMKPIQHQYSREAKKKTRVIQLGVIDKNESTHEGMRDITEHMHGYVPIHEDGHCVRILSVGDQMTVERQSAAQEEVRDAATPSKRREGLMPVTGDFHLLGNFYQGIWKKVYHRGSVGDIGTLYAAQKMLESNNVPQNPMKDINATKVFLDKYTEAMVIAAAMEFYGMEKSDSPPSKHKFDVNIHGDVATYMSSVLGEFVQKYALPAEEEITGASAQLTCPKCGNTYSVMNALREHIKKDHTADNVDKSTHDSVFAHSCSVLTMCLMCLDFTDARQNGDGPRIIRLMKYMLLYFRSAGKTKYAYQVLRQVAQVQCFLTPREAHNVIWNRFVNNKGRSDTNVELDRACEASNLVFKTHARELHGQVTQKSVDRISRSCQSIDKALKHVDKISKRKASASKRGGPDHKDDVLKLVDHLTHDKVFQVDPKGRYHKSFPGFTRGYVLSVDHEGFHGWMSRTLKDLSRRHMFSVIEPTDAE